MTKADKYGEALPFREAQARLKRERADVCVLSDWASDVFGLTGEQRDLLAEQYDKRLVMGGKESVLSYSLDHLTRRVSEAEVRERVGTIGQTDPDERPEGP